MIVQWLTGVEIAGWLLFDGMHSQAGLGNEIPLILGVIRSNTLLWHSFDESGDLTVG
jgi:hypothetical protein